MPAVTVTASSTPFFGSPPRTGAVEVVWPTQIVLVGFGWPLTAYVSYLNEGGRYTTLYCACCGEPHPITTLIRLFYTVTIIIERPPIYQSSGTNSSEMVSHKCVVKERNAYKMTYISRVTQSPGTRPGTQGGPALADLRGCVILGSRLPPCICLLYTSPSPRDRQKSRMPSSA